MTDNPSLEHRLASLGLHFMAQNHESLAKQAADKHFAHLDYLARLVEGEIALKLDRSINRRIKQARFPVIKTIDQFNWSWPKKINRLNVQHLFRLDFVPKKANVIFLGGVGLGKSHLAIALAYEACLKKYSVLFTTAIDAINTLSAAIHAGRLKTELARYVKPSILVLDEIGYLPIDKSGADLLFQILSYRYEKGSTIITSNRAYKHWPQIFNNDATLTSAILDRLLHHAETIVIEGNSYRMKDKTEST